MEGQNSAPPRLGRDDLSLYALNQRHRTFRTGIRTLGVLVVAWLGFRALEALGGQDTSVSIVVSLILTAFFELKFILAIILAAACAGWAVAERILRYRKVEQMQSRIIKLETAIDPGRTSSGLTPKGKTHPQDKTRD